MIQTQTLGDETTPHDHENERRDPRLNEMSELRRVLLPVLGFNSRDDAERYMDEAFQSLVQPQAIADFDHGIGYVMMPGWWTNLEAQMLAESHSLNRRSPNQIWEKIWDAGKPKPRDNDRPAFTTVLCIGGRRQWYRHHARDRAHDPWFWKRIDTGHRDCFVAFARRDGSLLDPFRVIDNGQLNGGRQSKTVSAARSGRLAIYAATTVYNRDGSIDGNEMRLLLAEFAVLDRDSRKDDMLRVQIVAQSHRFADPDAHIPEIDLSGRDLDESWLRLANEARNGFIRECAPAVHENEEYRRFHLRQRQGRETNDKLPYGQRFEDRLEGLSWEQAVELVREPWQMAIAIYKYSGETRFEDVPGQYSGSRGTRWEKMRAVLSPKEQERIAPMAGYVAQNDNMWNYCGD